ncbi:E3 ubiquitin-protein ligase bre1 [Zygosaccharomyces mellis]|uniref:E3 ubiquitin protein ligase n=1 Tax=Zygosaccharomyces mellis TaxID=42258 RepID=A0A4C2E8L2_9SACH|nr:E3 ubiquitin-protein ligase bre1 [Zygosaccharomyces mellis]
MSVEPATKKVKLELTSCDEPLTQKDVIAFQKEALFRCIHQKRINLESLENQYSLSKRQCADVTRKLANLMALVVTLARFLHSLCQLEEEKKICEQVSQGDETVIVQLSDVFMKLLTKYSGTENGDENTQGLAVALQALQRDKDEILYENRHLQDEVTRIKSYYEDIIRSYDREESQTVKRIFKKKDNTDENSVNEESLPNGTGVTKREITPLDENSSTNVEIHGNGNDDGKDVEQELRMQDLRSQIDALQTTVQSLERFKQQNEHEIIKLRKQLQEHQSKPSTSTQDTKDSHWEKIQHLTKQNDELSQVNEDLLTKFHELSKNRDVYSNNLAQELQTAQDGLKKHNSNLEKDLVRIRTTRDELLSKVAILETETSKSAMLQSLQSALDSLSTQWSKLEDRSKITSSPDIPQTQDALLKELQDLEQAFKNLSSITHKKYSEYINQESVISKLSVEKTKADQKYFAAMRSKDAILVENKNLSKNLTKSNDLISQLRDSDKLLRQKMDNLTKQIQLSQSNEKRLIDSNKITTLKTMDLNSELSKVKKSLNFTKDDNSKLTTQLTQLEGKLQSLETELKSIKIKSHNYETKCQKLQASLLANGGDNGPIVEELENFRTLVYCSLCSKNWKNMAIKSCGHIFCETCCKERLASRMRKCPTCNKAFSSNDLLQVHL